MDGLIELEFGEPIGVLDRGTTRPLLCRLEDASCATSEWVVKLPWLRRPEAAAAEIAAHRLLAPFGLTGVDIGVVYLPDPEFESAFDDSTDEGRALCNAIRTADQRSCFACRFIEAVEHVNGAFRQRTPKEVLRLFFFDAFVWHGDRTFHTPNILWRGGKMIAIDHARAFFGIEAIDETGLQLHDYRETRTEKWLEHVSLSYLRAQWQKGTLRVEDCGEIVTQIQTFGVDRLEDLVTNWPDSLASATFKSDLQRFVRTRFDILPSLGQEISHALAR